jgi:hypothetical protein
VQVEPAAGLLTQIAPAALALGVGMAVPYSVPVVGERANNFIGTLAGGHVKYATRLLGMAVHSPASKRLLLRYSLDSVIPWWGPTAAYALPLIPALKHLADSKISAGQGWAAGAALFDFAFYSATGYHEQARALAGQADGTVAINFIRGNRPPSSSLASAMSIHANAFGVLDAV